MKNMEGENDKVRITATSEEGVAVCVFRFLIAFG